MKQRGRRDDLRVHQRLRRRLQADPVPAHAERHRGAQPGGRAGARRSCSAMPGAVDIGLSTKGQKPELEVDLNRGVAGSLGVTVGQVAQSLRPAFAGIDAGDWDDPTGEMREGRRCGSSPSRAATPTTCTQLPLVVMGPNGVPTTMPLGQVATIKQGVGPAIIDHLDREPVVTVEVNNVGPRDGRRDERRRTRVWRRCTCRPACGIRSAATRSRSRGVRADLHGARSWRSC